MVQLGFDFKMNSDLRFESIFLSFFLGNWVDFKISSRFHICKEGEKEIKNIRLKKWMGSRFSFIYKHIYD